MKDGEMEEPVITSGYLAYFKVRFVANSKSGEY